MQFYNTRWFWIVVLLVLLAIFFVSVAEADWLIGIIND